ncbi:MAG TPA: hypothetical protein VFI92_03420 [Steroidobacteraceae bacterium]|nr:hypothetical protein [Steroidobacteraceae bacterium]
MTSLIRDVLFPSVAAVGLLAAAAIDTATAEEAAPAAKPAVIAAASVGAVSQQATAPSHERAPVVAPADEQERSVIERRCERTGRIGKFRITRCD